MIIAVTLSLLVVVGAAVAGFWLGEPGIGLAAAFFVALVLVYPVVTYAHAHHNERTLTCTVTDKDRGGDEGSYRIYTDQCGQLANTDTLWRGKFDSADLWQQIQPGQTYRLTIVGWRSGLMSTFPNVLSVEPVR